MNAPAFTPGPWHVGPMSQSIRPDVTNSHLGQINGGCVIANLYGRDIADNANLIAAAPELYETLAELLRVDDEWHGAVNSEMSVARSKARTALARARGETP